MAWVRLFRPVWVQAEVIGKPSKQLQKQLGAARLRLSYDVFVGNVDEIVEAGCGDWTASEERPRDHQGNVIGYSSGDYLDRLHIAGKPEPEGK